MKKLFMLFAAAMMAASVSAQSNTAITANKAGDNWYFGVNAGVTTRVKESFSGADDGMFKSLAPTVGLRLGKNLTTVFGLAADADMYFMSNDKFFDGSKTFVEAIDVNLMGTFNLSNLFAGYPGEPRAFELIALGGFGWEHDFNHLPRTNGLNSKVALDFAFNLGAAKAWQLYIEPALTYCLHDWYDGQDVGVPFQYNLNRSVFSVKAGLNYKFGTSNGTHNFAKEQLRDQAEIDALNAKINAAKSEADAAKADAAAKAAKIAELQKALNDCMNKPAPVVEKAKANLQPSVVFKQGKSVVERSQEANLEMIAKYMNNNKDAKIKISGYASPEGSKELNQKLSEKRAEACKNILVKKYKIDANRLETEGLGATDKLFDEVEFNRVALFNDVTK